MEINSKQLMIAAAIGGAAWFLLRKKPAASTGSASGLGSGLANILGGLGGAASSGSAMTPVSTKPLEVTSGAAGTVRQPAPLAAGPGLGAALQSVVGSLSPLVPGSVSPAAGAAWAGPVAGGSPPITGAVFGGGSGPSNSTPDPSYNSGGTFGYLTPEQRGGKTDGQLALSILGY
jgi:hypothetical protein